MRANKINEEITKFEFEREREIVWFEIFENEKGKRFFLSGINARMQIQEKIQVSINIMKGLIVIKKVAFLISMKECTKEYLLTPKKEGFQTYNRFQKIQIEGGKLTTPQNIQKSSELPEEQLAPIFKSPIIICQSQNIMNNISKLQSNSSLPSNQISPRYQQADDNTLIHLSPHHNLLDIREGKDSQSKAEEKSSDLNVSNGLNALSSVPPSKYNELNSYGQSPLQPFIEKALIRRLDQESPFNDQNELAKFACQTLVEIIRKEDPFLKGNLVIKNPKFEIEILNQEEMKEFKSSHLQKDLLQSLDFSNFSFNYDVSQKSLEVIDQRFVIKKQNSEIISQKQKINQISNQISPTKNNQILIPYKGSKLQLPPPYYGFPYPGCFFDYGINPMQPLSSETLNAKNQSEKKQIQKGVDKSQKLNQVKEEAAIISETKLNSIIEKSPLSEVKQTKAKENNCEEKNDQKSKSKDREQISQKQSQQKASLSTAKKRKLVDSSNKVNKDEDILNSKRKHFGTPNTKKFDTSTPSTKKKCAKKQSVSEQKDGTQQKNQIESSQKKQQSEQSTNKRQNDEECSHDHTNSHCNEELDEQKKECCGCKKTKCLKLYCECFQAKRYCVGSNCQGCHNRPEFDDLRVSAMESIQRRNSGAFNPKADKLEEIFESDDGQKIHSKGCNCKKSDCRKKYCECFQMGAKCTDLCKCYNCKNGTASADALQFSQPFPLPSFFFLEQNGIQHPNSQFLKQKQHPFFYYGPQAYPQFEQWGHPIFPQGEQQYLKKIEEEDDDSLDANPLHNFQKIKQICLQKLSTPEVDKFASVSKSE